MTCSGCSARWLAFAETDAASAVLVHNPGPTLAIVELTRLDGTLLESIDIASGTWARIEVRSGLDAVLVEADRPVVVSSTAERVGDRGVMWASAFPIG